MEQPDNNAMPKKSCMVTLAFESKSDEESLIVKKAIDKAIENIEKKRYTFQFIES